MENLVDKLSNRSGPTLISYWQGLQIIIISIVVSAESYFITMDMFFILGTLTQVGAHPKEKEKPLRDPLDVLLLGPTLEGQQGRSSQVRGPIHIKFESISDSTTSI